MILDRAAVRDLTALAVRIFGTTSSAEQIEEFVFQLSLRLNASAGALGRSEDQLSSRIVVSVLGKNRPGIVASVANVLSQCECDIRDLNQTLVQDKFAMIMIVDMSRSNTSFGDLKRRLRQLADEMGLRVYAQREDIFTAMQRI